VSRIPISDSNPLSSVQPLLEHCAPGCPTPPRKKYADFDFLGSRTGSSTTEFSTFSTSSKQYFLFLLNLQTGDWLTHGPPYRVETVDWTREFMEGYITSADTGAEDLIRASRAALAEFCEAGNTHIVYDALVRILEKQLRHDQAPNEDRVVVPCLEVVSFLFDAGLLQSLQFRYFTTVLMSSSTIRLTVPLTAGTT
jgi:Tubulin folding cofactor D C terminal